MSAARPAMDAVYRYIDRHAARFIEELGQLLRIRSVAEESGELERAARWLRSRLEEAGLQARLIGSSGRPMVFGEHSPEDGGAPTVLVYGHYDVMPAGDRATWHSDPFEPTERDGRIYCRGAGDNKGQHFAHIKALEAMMACGVPVPPLKFLIEGEEETGSRSLPGFVTAHRALLAADLCYAADGPRHESDRPTIYLGCRGVIGLELLARGANRDLHSGNRGNVVPDPGWRLVEALASLGGPGGEIAFDGFREGVRTPTTQELAHLAALPFDGARLAVELEVPELASMRAAEYYRRLMFSPSLTINGLVCGYTGPGTKTVIPSRAVAKMDLRLVADQDPERVVERLREHLRVRGFGDLDLLVHHAMKPSRTALDDPFVAPIVEAIGEASGEEPVVWPALGGSIPQYAFVDGLGVPCVWSAYANWDEANHAPDENLRVDLFIQSVKMSASVFARLATLPRRAPAAPPRKHP